MPAVFIDTNVILNGSLDPSSTAGQLVKVVDRISFLTADGVVAEAEFQIRKHSEGKLQISALQRLHRFLSSIRVVVVPTLHGKGMGDADWKKVAKEYHCTDICTYDLRGFPGFKVVTPEGLLSRRGMTDIVSFPRLSARGTLFLGFRIYHPLNNFVLIEGEGGQIVISKKNEIHVVGGGATQKIKSRFKLGYYVNLVVRYRSGENFEALDFGAANSGGHSGTFLTTGKFSLKEPIRTKLVFGPGHGFNGEIGFIDGYPNFLGDNDVISVLQNGSTALLEASMSTENLLQIWNNWEVLGIW